MGIKYIYYKELMWRSDNIDKVGNSLAVQWLGLHASTAGGVGSILGRGTKILHATQSGQKNPPKNIYIYVKLWGCEGLARGKYPT